MNTEESVPQTAENAVITESAPVIEVNENDETIAGNTESASGEVSVRQTAEVEPNGPNGPNEPNEPNEPSKAVKELISQRKKRQEAERETAYWRGIAEGRGHKQEPAKENIVSGPIYGRDGNVYSEPVSPTKPDINKFEDYSQYLAAELAYDQAREEYLIQKAEYRIGQRVESFNKKQQIQTIQQKFSTVIEKAASIDPSIYDIVNDPSLPVSDNMVPLIQSSDFAPQILKFLYNNRKEGQRIAYLPAIMAAKEIGMIEARLSSAPPPNLPKKVSLAPNPIPTVSPTGTSMVDEENLPIDQWIKRRNKQTNNR